MLYCYDTHYVQTEENMDKDKNNLAKLKALFSLLTSSFDKDIGHLYVFGNSALDVNWMNAQGQIQDTSLPPLAT